MANPGCSASKEIEDNLIEEGFVEQLEIGLEGDTTNAKIIEELEVKQKDVKTSKKLTSPAWDHFNLITVNGVLKAKCNYCPAILSYKGSSGTSHLLKHANQVCPRRHLRMGMGQTQLNVKTQVDGTTVLELKDKEKPIKFDQDTSRRDLVSMVVIHEYPLSIVDHVGFRKFVKGLNSSFKMISRNTLKNDIMKNYDDAKSSLKALFECTEGRVAITTDMWTASNQKKGYMVVTSHFIDQEWSLRNRTLRLFFFIVLMGSPQSVVSPLKSSFTESEKQHTNLSVEKPSLMSKEIDFQRKETTVGNVEDFLGAVEVYIHQARDILL